MVPAIGLSGLVSVAIALVLVDSIAISAWDAGVGAFLGVVQLAIGYACITIATKHLRASMVALLLLSEAVFAPVFVWVGVGEAPTVMAAIGGLVVLTAVGFQASQIRE